MRKLLDRAKGLLQAEQGMSEAEAFRWIQKSSMDRRMTMRAVAEEVLQGVQKTGGEQAGSPATPGLSPSQAAPSQKALPGAPRGTRRAAPGRARPASSAACAGERWRSGK